MTTWNVLCPICRKVMETGSCYKCHEDNKIQAGHKYCEVPVKFLKGLGEYWKYDDYEAVYMDRDLAVEEFGECKCEVDL